MNLVVVLKIVEYAPLNSFNVALNPVERVPGIVELRNMQKYLVTLDI